MLIACIYKNPLIILTQNTQKYQKPQIFEFQKIYENIWFMHEWM